MNSTIQIIRGDTAKFKFQRLDGDGQVITTTPDYLYFTVKESSNKLKYVFQKTLDDMTIDSDGTYHFVVKPENTNGLQYGNYAYDIEVITDGVKSTIAYGTFNIFTTTPDYLYFTVKESSNKLKYVFQKTLDDMTIDSDGTYHFVVIESAISSAVAIETENRQTADNGLQSQIDAITASSDVTDIVGTYAALEAYDTSKLGDNDIIKVLQDETHSNETTYYRWNKTAEEFTLIGEEGPYYTKSQADQTFATISYVDNLVGDVESALNEVNNGGSA